MKDTKRIGQNKFEVEKKKRSMVKIDLNVFSNFLSRRYASFMLNFSESQPIYAYKPNAYSAIMLILPLSFS